MLTQSCESSSYNRVLSIERIVSLLLQTKSLQMRLYYGTGSCDIMPNVSISLPNTRRIVCWRVILILFTILQRNRIEHSCYEHLENLLGDRICWRYHRQGCIRIKRWLSSRQIWRTSNIYSWSLRHSIRYPSRLRNDKVELRGKVKRLWGYFMVSFSPPSGSSVRLGCAYNFVLCIGT